MAAATCFSEKESRSMVWTSLRKGKKTLVAAATFFSEKERVGLRRGRACENKKKLLVQQQLFFLRKRKSVCSVGELAKIRECLINLVLSKLFVDGVSRRRAPLGTRDGAIGPKGGGTY